MAYCTRCGKEIELGARCSCQKSNSNALRANENKADYFGFGSLLVPKDDETAKVMYERGEKIVPDNIIPDQGEVPIRQYNLCVMRSRIKFMRAEGRLQITNKRVVFRAKGVSLTGPTTVQHEFSIPEMAGFQINKNFRFSGLDFFWVLLSSLICGALGGALSILMMRTDIVLLSVLLGIIGVGAGFYLRQNTYVAAILSAFSIGMWSVAERFMDKKIGVYFIILLVLVTLVLLISSIARFSFKPNLAFHVLTKTGGPVMPLRCERHGFGKFINAEYTGYSEVLPTDETEKAMAEVGAVLSDIQKLGDLAIQKWKEN